MVLSSVLMTLTNLVTLFFWLQIFRKEPFFYGHDNHDQLVKIAKVGTDVCFIVVFFLFDLFFQS